MKIAVVSPGSFSVPPVIGSSVEHDIYMIAKEYRRKSHPVIIYTRKCKQYPKSTRDNDFHIRRFYFKNYSQYLSKVIKDLQKQKPDIIQVENRPIYVPAIKNFFPNTPVVLVMHSKVFASSSVISRNRMNQVIKQMDAMITNSRYLRNYFAKRYRRHSHKIFPVHLGIDIAPFKKAEEDQEQINQWKHQFKITDDDHILLFIGRIKKEKGVHLLIESLPKILKHKENVKLLITGSPVYGRNIETKYVYRIKKAGRKCRKHIIYTRFIKPDKIPYLIQLADIVVTPSVWNEPFCRVNLEAMASGKPVITTNRGGIPEVVSGGGIIIPLHEWKREFPKVINSLTTEQLSDMGCEGRERAELFSWDKTAEGYLEVFRLFIPQSNTFKTLGV